MDWYAYERSAWARGFRRVAGVDEVGRGPLAGPVVAAAVILPEAGVSIPVADSKSLTARQRACLARALWDHSGVRIGIAAVEASRIDEIHIVRATVEAMAGALRALGVTVDLALVDGLPLPGFPGPAEFVVKGDALSASIAAASIVAKVHRDTLMVRLDAEYPGYGFARHKGYGTAQHGEALSRLGPTPVHRRSFAPLALSRGERPTQLNLPLGA